MYCLIPLIRTWAVDSTVDGWLAHPVINLMLRKRIAKAEILYMNQSAWYATLLPAVMMRVSILQRRLPYPGRAFT